MPETATAPAPVSEVLSTAVAALGGQQRDGQVQMAIEVAEAMEEGRHLLVQAGTSTGKSLGYLVPAMLHDKRVVVATATQWFTYRVTAHEIVSPKQVSVIAPVPDQPGQAPTQAYLTFTACHPMHSARQRYVVHALLESTQDRSAGPPASLAAVS